MTFQQLQYLLEIHHTGSASKAAKNLFVSQPSISASLSTLENELGFPIFTRNQQGLLPTPEGKLVIEYAKRICSTHALLTNIQKGQRHAFRLSSNSYVPINRAYGRLIEENKHREDITFSAIHCSVSQTKQKLLSCELDVGILFTLSSWASEIQKQLDSLGLEWQVIKSVPIVIRIGPKHPLYHVPELSPMDFKDDCLIEGPCKEISQSVFRGILPINQKRVIICNNNDMNNHFVSQGLGYSVGVKFSDYITQHFGLRYVPLTGYTYEVIVITNPIQAPTPEVSRFLELLTEEFENY